MERSKGDGVESVDLESVGLIIHRGIVTRLTFCVSKYTRDYPKPTTRERKREEKCSITAFDTCAFSSAEKRSVEGSQGQLL
ncbi:hypothetical protein PROFUN_02048 [Planoprotostelium fungivorum]|uniref:Uncharacterized protein n=1 Tax=Planoprotostelium fungivorum TaxID=1890364 RepID=A0A2P6NB83_9EUKA|nr:hypothetical protein PROFUN_02048 [Planoprotostelium fungivorum]